MSILKQLLFDTVIQLIHLEIKARYWALHFCVSKNYSNERGVCLCLWLFSAGDVCWCLLAQDMRESGTLAMFLVMEEQVCQSNRVAH